MCVKGWLHRTQLEKTPRTSAFNIGISITMTSLNNYHKNEQTINRCWLLERPALLLELNLLLPYFFYVQGNIYFKQNTQIETTCRILQCLKIVSYR